jgi:siderophore synthetase component
LQQGEFFFRDYVAKLLPPLLRLAAVHGIGLHANLRNTLLVVRDGRVDGFLLRDLAHVRVSREHLERAGHGWTLPSGADPILGTYEEVHGHVLDGLLGDHLPAVLHWLEGETGFPMAAGLEWTRVTLEQTLAQWSAFREPVVDWQRVWQAYTGPSVRLTPVLAEVLPDGAPPGLVLPNPLFAGVPLARAA